MKKLILSAIAASVAATGFAGSYAVPAAKPASAQFAYVELDGGYAMTNQIGSIYPSGSDFFNAYNHPNGALGGGIAAGYHFMPNLGVEAGFLMPFQKTSLKSGYAIVDQRGDVLTAQKLSEYSAYAAARLDANIADNVNLFALAGFGFTHAKSEQTVDGIASSPTESGFGFAGGVGADYTVANNFVIGAKYLLLPGRDKVSDTDAPFPGPQYLLVSVGYKFGM
jgi:opacity protein-like surface antigen